MFIALRKSSFQSVRLALLVGLVVFAGSCSSSKDKEEDNFKISGRLGSGFALHGQLFGSLKLVNSTEVDQIWAIPLDGVSIIPQSLHGRIILDIASDGSFVFDPNEEDARSDLDYIFALVNSDQCNQDYQLGNSSATDHMERRECIKGYVSLPDMIDNSVSTSSDGNLYAFPFSKMASDLELGELTRNDNPGDANGDAQSETTLEEQVLNFSVDLNALRSLARSDTVLKNLKNVYANYDNDFDRSVGLQMAYNWFVSEENRPAALAAVRNSFKKPNTSGSAYPDFVGFHFYVSTNVNTQDYTVTDDGDGELIKIIPPGPIYSCGPSDGVCEEAPAFSNTSPFVASWPVTIPEWGDFATTRVDNHKDFLFRINDGDGTNAFFGSLSSISSGVSPEGYWDIYMNSTGSGDIGAQHFLGRFDMSLTEPFARTAEGVSDPDRPLVYFPAIRLVTSSDDIITGIDIQFYQFINDAFTLVDSSMVHSIVSLPYFYFGSDNCEMDTEAIDGRLTLGQDSLDLTTWDKTIGFPGTDAGDCDVNMIGFNYRMSGISFHWHW